MTVRRVSGPSVDLGSKLRALDGFVGKTGYFETARYPDGTPVAYVATVHEFGSPEGNIPARPTMRPTAARKQAEWGALAGQGARAVLRGEQSPEAVLELLALGAAGDVAQAIREVQTPALKPQTIERKGFAKPLVDTGVMLQSVTGVVESKA